MYIKYAIWQNKNSNTHPHTYLHLYDMYACVQLLYLKMKKKNQKIENIEIADTIKLSHVLKSEVHKSKHDTYKAQHYVYVYNTYMRGDQTFLVFIRNFAKI